MEFTEHGLIRIEDNGKDGQVLGLAVALGEKTLEDFGQAEVNTRPRDLDTKETTAAIHGLARMTEINSMPLGSILVTLDRNKVGYNGLQAFHRHGHSALYYLKQIALHGILETQSVG